VVLPNFIKNMNLDIASKLNIFQFKIEERFKFSSYKKKNKLEIKMILSSDFFSFNFICEETILYISEKRR
jgi:hypothetical protein